MAWTFTADPYEYRDAASELILADPVRNTISAVGMERWMRDGVAQGSYFGWCCDDSGSVRGVASTNPPWPLLLDAMPEELLPSLVDALVVGGLSVTGVNAAVPIAATFAAMWTARTGAAAELSMVTRLFELGELVPPRHGVPGSPRRADEGDLALLVAWMRAFLADLDEPDHVEEASMRSRIGVGELWLWDTPSGEPVSMVGRTPPAAGVSRVGPVYTPPEHRRRGYAAALTHAACAEARGEGLGLVLFADQANPTSTGIYRALGFAPVQDRMALRFTG